MITEASGLTGSAFVLRTQYFTIFMCEYKNVRARGAYPREADWLGIGAPLSGSSYFYVVPQFLFCHEAHFQCGLWYFLFWSHFFSG